MKLVILSYKVNLAFIEKETENIVPFRKVSQTISDVKLLCILSQCEGFTFVIYMMQHP